MQGDTYDWAFYVYNNGSQQVFITYEPTSWTASGGQTAVTISVTAIEYGLPSETTDNNLVPPLTANALPYALPEKSVATPTAGFLLDPDKVVKLDVDLYVSSIVEGQTCIIPFDISGVNVQTQVS
jgi:hypothetical protein